MRYPPSKFAIYPVAGQEIAGFEAGCSFIFLKTVDLTFATVIFGSMR